MERRRFYRQPVRKDALACADDRSVECAVMDISEFGVRLCPTDPTAVIPDRFRLLIWEDSVKVECEVVHRSQPDGALGAKFTRAPRGMRW